MHRWGLRRRRRLRRGSWRGLVGELGMGFGLGVGRGVVGVAW